MSGTIITRVLAIEGMMTEHEAAGVQAALRAVPGVMSATVDFDRNQATVVTGNDVSDLALMNAVSYAGADPLSCWIANVQASGTAA